MSSLSPVSPPPASAVFRFALSLSLTPFLSLSLFLFWGLGNGGCATARFRPPSAPLRITSNVPDATVWVDDHLVAKVSDFAHGEKRLPAGFHRIEIRAPGYYSYFQELEVNPDAPVSVQAPLHQLLD